MLRQLGEPGGGAPRTIWFDGAGPAFPVIRPVLVVLDFKQQMASWTLYVTLPSGVAAHLIRHTDLKPFLEGNVS